jgi:hypothetical protein
MKLAPKRLPILLVLALGACKSLSSDANEPAPDAAIPAQAAPAEKKPVDEGELRKKTREVEYARMSLEIAKLAAENDAKASKKAVEAADRELGAAKGERDNFKKTLLALELDERALALDRAKQNVLEAEQELAELEGMYAQEQFAGTTKELVLTRGRARLEMSKRDLDLAQRRAEQTKSFEHKKRERELGEHVTKAQVAVDEAKAKLEKQKLESALSLRRAQHALEDAERELAALQ